MNWIIEHLQILIGAAAAIAYFLNRRNRSEGEEDENLPRNANAGADEQAERTRRVQDEIRRKIAERRGLAPEFQESQKTLERLPPVVPPPIVPPLDPFGGSARRMLRKIEEAAQNMEQRFEDPEAVAKAAEIARRAKLAEELRELEAARLAQEHRAAAIAAARKKKEMAAALAPSGLGDFRAALRDPRELRRAVVLREVLGPPVGLR